MSWMLQETDHRNEVVRKVMFDDKPNQFLIADYLPQVAYQTALLSTGMISLPNNHIWMLVEVSDVEYPPELGDSVRALRRIFDKETLYMLVYNGDKHAAKWLEFGEIIGQITYKRGWYFRSGIEGGRMWVQVGVTADAEIAYDPVAKAVVPWRGAKHYLSPHMCRQEIVGTVHHAIERAEMHELNEWFRYKGRAIYNPHLDPDRLAEFAAKLANFNTRENAMTMEEPS